MTELPLDQTSDSSDSSTQKPSEANKRPTWTLLLYLAGDNNLSEECVYLLKQIARVGTEDDEDRGVPKLNVVAQFDPLGRANPTRRFKITGTGGEPSLPDFEIPIPPEERETRERRTNADKGETDTSDPKTLLKFLCESIATNDSDHYMVVLSGHGAGISEGFFLEDDERPLSSIPSSFPIPALKEMFASPKLKEALNGKKIDILGFDSCMMSMVEICYQMSESDVLNLVVAAEGFALNSSWPFENIVKKIKHSSGIAPEDLARYITKTYSHFYSDYALGGLSVDLSAIRLERIGTLREKIDELAEAMIDAFDMESGPEATYSLKGKPFQDAILLAHWGAQSYNGEQCVDLYDFCDLLETRLLTDSCNLLEKSLGDKPLKSVVDACEQIKSEIKALVIDTQVSGSAFQFSNGISIYFPWARFDKAKGYNESLDFVKKSAWNKFLDVYLKATQRPGRPGTRSTPPTSKGPQGVVHSMRNPPYEVSLPPKS